MSKTARMAHSPRMGLPDRFLRDQALASRISGGDRSAFDEMFRRYHQQIYRFCSAMVGPEEGKDMLQNVMTKAMTSMPHDEDFQMKPWLYRVARNECVDHIRSARRTDSGLEADGQVDDSSRADPHQSAVDREQLNQLVNDLNGLPEKQRATLVMRELSGLSYQEIADSLGSSEAGAKQIVYEARLSLEQAELGRKLACADVRELISARDRRKLRGRQIRSHMRHCQGCTDFEKAISSRETSFQALSPVLPLAAAAGILGAVRDGGTAVGAVGGGAAAAASGGVVSGGVATGLVTKGVVALVVAGGIGVGTAEVARHHRDASTGQAVTRESSQTLGLGTSAGFGPKSTEATTGDRAFGEHGREGGKREGHGDEGRSGSGRERGGSEKNGQESSGHEAGNDSSGERVTPGQGQGNGPAELPEASSKGQARADEASSAVPGKTGSPPPSQKPATPPGTSSGGSSGNSQGNSGSAATESSGGNSESAPAVGKPESPGKSGN